MPSALSFVLPHPAPGTSSDSNRATQRNRGRVHLAGSKPTRAAVRVAAKVALTDDSRSGPQECNLHCKPRRLKTGGEGGTHRRLVRVQCAQSGSVKRECKAHRAGPLEWR